MKKLSLKAEHLTELTSDELSLAVGGLYTSDTRCIVISHEWCVVPSVNLNCVTRLVEA